MSSAAAPLLRVQDLQVEIASGRRTVHAVRGASFDVRSGEALGIVGESGSGKTMALRSVVGLLPRVARVAGGSIAFGGEDLAGAPEARLQEVRGAAISMVFQEPMTALNPVMRVGEQIAEGPLVRGGASRAQARERALELMRLVGIPDPERRYRAYPHELSGGLRQRVVIAIALAAEPRLVLCDEPTTALDVTIQDQILKLLGALRERLGVALIIVSHDLAVIAQSCQRIAVMYAGQVVETGAVDEVFRAPRHPYTLSLLRSVPDYEVVRHRLATIPGTPPDLSEPPPGCPFHPRCPFARDDCTAGDFPLRALGPPGRATACIHPDACAADVEREPVIAGA
jgi:oligopeptide/dipeptide ABC transporter ATP-binding protein